MGESPEVDEEIISTILQFPVKVLRVIPQSTIANLQGRSVRLDVLADVVRVEAELMEDCPIGEKGAKVNIEVQKDNNDDHQRRVRYNASVITANETPTGAKFRNVPDVVAIFISKFDVFKEGEMLYQIDRKIRKSGTEVFNGFTEIYVNAAVKDRSTEGLSAIADLMEIFVEEDRYDYDKFPKTSKRKDQFKNTEEGVKSMSRDLEAWADNRAREREVAGAIETYREFGTSDDDIINRIMDRFNVTKEYVQALLSPQVTV